MIRWLRTAPGASVPGTTGVDLLLAGGLTLLTVLSVAGHDGRPPVLAELLAVPMVAPLAWRRRAPLAAASTMAVAAAANGLLIGSLPRCVGALPAVLFVAYSAGCSPALRLSLAALVACLLDSAAQAQWDPRLGGLGSFAGVGPATAAAWVVGRVVLSRSLLADRLRERTRELREQRQATAALAVANERSRVAAELDRALRARIGQIAGVTEEARTQPAAGPDETARALGTVEASSREALHLMRDVVGGLREEAPVTPQPTLADLPRLIHRAVPEGRLTVAGDPRRLAAGIELSAYRIVENLLAALENAPDAQVDVRLTYAADALEIVVGVPASASPVDTSSGALRTRVEWHGGTVRTRMRSDRRETLVRLPLVSAHA